MQEREREIMPDIISAKCFGCGNIVRVPSALGGKKARCPKCTETIVIPAQADSNAELVSDTDLPEVARDDEVLEGEEIEVEEGELVHDTPRGRRPGSSSRHTKVVTGRGGPQKRGSPVRKSGSAGLFIGIGIAVVAIVVVIAVAAGGKGGGGKKKDDEKSSQKTAPAPKVDPVLEGRLQEYARAWSRGDDKDIIKFHAYDPGEEGAVRKAIFTLLEQQVKYENAVVKSADGESGATTFSYTSGGATQEKSLQWTKVEGVWKVSGRP